MIMGWLRDMSMDWNWNLLWFVFGLWGIGTLLDIFGVDCLEDLGVIGANVKRFVRGLTVYITAILIGAPLVAVMGCSPKGSGADFAVNVGLIISFVIAAKTPGYMEGVALYYIFKKK